MTLGDNIQLDAILIPQLHLHLQPIEVPEQFTDIEEEFADQETFAVEAQILIGADRSKLFPDWLKNADGTFIESDNCRIMRSVITNKLILFGACTGHDHQEEQMEVEEDHTSTHSTQADPNVESVSACLLYTSPSPRDGLLSRMPSSA